MAASKNIENNPMQWNVNPPSEQNFGKREVDTSGKSGALLHRRAYWTEADRNSGPSVAITGNIKPIVEI